MRAAAMVRLLVPRMIWMQLRLMVVRALRGVDRNRVIGAVGREWLVVMLMVPFFLAQ